MSKHNSGKRNAKKIILLGIDPQRQAVYEEELKGHHVTFAMSSEAVIRSAGWADVVAINIDKHDGFIETLLKGGYERAVVAIANSRKLMGKLIHRPNGEKITPVCHREATAQIMKLIAT